MSKCVGVKNVEKMPFAFMEFNVGDKNSLLKFTRPY